MSVCNVASVNETDTPIGSVRRYSHSVLHDDGIAPIEQPALVVVHVSNILYLGVVGNEASGSFVPPQEAS